MFSNILLPDVALKYNVTSHFKFLLPFEKDRVLRQGESWVEDLRQGISSQQHDPISHPGIEERARLKKMVKEVRLGGHYHIKKDTISILETPASILKF